MKTLLFVFFAAAGAVVFGQGLQVPNPVVRFTDGTNVINAGDNSNNAIRVNVVAGSSGNGAASNTGSAVPTQADYQGLNVSGTLRGATGVNPTGSVYAQQMDLASVGGTSVALGQAAMASSIPVAIANNQSALAVSESGTWNVGLSAGTNLIGYTRPQNACGTTNYEAGMQYLPNSSTQLTATATCIASIQFFNNDTATHMVSVQDQGTGCNSGVCQILNAFTLQAGANMILPLAGAKFTGGIKWNADAANKVIANVIGNQ
jgi:hypothetical protein